MLFADAVFNIFIGVFDVRIVFNVFSVMFAKTSLFFCVVLYGVMICFGSLERDYSLFNGDMTLEKGLRSQHGLAKMFSCMTHSDRLQAVNELSTISASM